MNKMKSFVGEDGRLRVEKVSLSSGDGMEKKSFNGAVRDFLSGGEMGNSRAELRKAYARSPWVMRAIMHCSNPITAVPLNFTQNGDQVDIKSVTSFWNRPSREPGGRMRLSDLVRTSVGWWKLKGEFFWILDDTWLTKGSLASKSPILVARPDEMREVLDRASGELLGWEYTARGGRGKEMLIPEQVIHKKSWNPYHDVRGLSEWEAAEMAAEADYSAATFAKNVMDSNGDRGPIVTGEGSISDAQYEQITRTLREKRERNRSGDFRPAFLVGSNLKVEDPAVQAVDTAFITQRLENRHEIFIAFGVPASFAEVVASYSIGSASDRFRNIEENCMPMAEVIEEAISEVMNGAATRPPVSEAEQAEVMAIFDWDEHSTMQQVRGERMECAVKMVGLAVPWTVASDYLNLKLPRFKGDDVGRVPFNLIPVDESSVGSRKTAVDEDEETEGKSGDDGFRMIRKAFASRDERVRREKVADEEKALERKAKERAKLWQKVHRAREPWEKRFKSRFTRLLMKARKEVLANIAAAGERGELKGLVTKAGAIDLGFNLPGWLEDFLGGLTEISRNAMDSAAEELWIDELLREDDPAELSAGNVIEFLKGRENRLKETAKEIHQDILDELEEGINEGETMEELSDRVRGAFNGIDKQRADTIAKTETTSAYETARQETYENAGVEYKGWLDSDLDNVRHTHSEASGQVVKVDEKFEVGGHKLMHPGDPEGPAAEVINCNCVSVATVEPGEKE